jgi:hypothetical protein
MRHGSPPFSRQFKKKEKTLINTTTLRSSGIGPSQLYDHVETYGYGTPGSADCTAVLKAVQSAYYDVLPDEGP